ncbi:hypothetical protein JXA84_02690 [candidate division WOR-3 bacterium]|nr:hypothetical protein [candidate division WOR-3 bacterium]
MKKLFTSVLPLATLVVFIHGCCGSCDIGEKISERVGEEIGEQITEEITGDDVDISDGSITIQDSTGSYHYSSEVDLDEYDIHEDLIYPGGKPKSVMHSGDDEFDHYSLVFETEDSPKKAIEYYKNLSGYEVLGETASDGSFFVEINQEDLNVTVATNHEEGVTLVTVVYVEEK